MGGIFGPMVFGYALVIGVPLIALLFAWLGIFKGARALRRTQIDDCGAEHPMEWVSKRNRVYYVNRPILCLRPEGHEGMHSDSDGAGSNHRWDHKGCRDIFCAKCGAEHPRDWLRDKRHYISSMICRQHTGHEGLHVVQVTLAGQKQRHKWGRAGCVHKACDSA